jgi:hypothetical protein
MRLIPDHSRFLATLGLIGQPARQGLLDEIDMEGGPIVRARANSNPQSGYTGIVGAIRH